jgi:hypothetical protein
MVISVIAREAREHGFNVDMLTTRFSRGVRTARDYCLPPPRESCLQVVRPSDYR